jgi:phytoene dehydrogenase-like protein
MEQKSIIIIGAGIAGLSAGSYGQMNGYSTKIFESHSKPGGLCTSWKKEGYTIDGCFQWLVGSSRESSMYRVWEELGAVQGRRMINYDEFLRIEGADGKVFILYTDADRLEKHMLEIAPQDENVIRELIKGVRTFASTEFPVGKAPELYGFLDGLRMMVRMLPFMGAWRKWRGISVEDFAKTFKEPFLREAFPVIFWGLHDFPMMALMMTVAWLHKKTAGFPEGGSLEVARAIERRYIGLGGELHYNSKVAKIVVENDQAVGVRLDDGTEHRSDIVISAADGHSTIFNMLDAKYVDDKTRGYYEKLPIFRPQLQVSLGVARDLSKEPHSLIYQLDKPVVIAGETLKWFGWRHYCFDPTLTPQGKSVVVYLTGSDYEYWRKLYQDSESYAAEKKRTADVVIAQLEKRYPGITEQIEVVDVATPMTYERYTGNWQGSMEGWLLTTKTLGMRMSKTLPGLRNFYMSGQWVEPGGGVPTAAMSGRNTIQIISKRDEKSFVTKA